MWFHLPSLALIVSILLNVRVLLASNELFLTNVRSYDGDDRQDGLGKAHTPLMRLADTTSYTDGRSAMMEGPNPRMVSDIVHAQRGDSILNARGLSDLLWQFGQFVDHDRGLTLTTKETANIAMPTNMPDGIDDVLENQGCGSIPFMRSVFIGDNPREQMNAVTSFIDASTVYGSDENRAKAVRTFQNGTLKTSSDGNLPSFNTEHLANLGGTSSDLFLLGDIRGNENIALFSVQTLFLREHNRLAAKIKEKYPTSSDEDIYQMARKLVGAEVQAITYKEFLPALLGPMAPDLNEYSGYDSNVDPRSSNEFSAAIYRVGHTMVSSRLLLANAGGPIGSVLLRDGFFNPGFFKDDPLNVDHILGGLLTQRAQEIDEKIVDDLRIFLYDHGDTTMCMDLAAINIQRGRDHGILPYNGVREAVGLARKKSFAEITSDPETQHRLAQAYNSSVDDVDAWVGALSEEHMDGASVGELIGTVLRDQFTRLMNGDPFFYLDDSDVSAPGISSIVDIHSISLSEIIRHNTLLKNLDSSHGPFFT